MAPTVKDEFENVSGGWIGVQVHDEGRRSGFKGAGLAPGARIWLDTDEQIATANKPRKEADNPFANGQLKKTASGQEIGSRRPIGDSMPVADEEPEAPAEEQPPATNPEDEMTEQQKAEHNAKEAAKRAVPPPAPKQSSATEAKAPVPPAATEQVATPEATAAAGEAEQGQRAAGERVGTPEAQGK